MPKLTQYQCDFPGCTQIRTPSNHWFTLGIGKNYLAISAMDTSPEVAALTVKCYMCSEAHLIQYVSTLLNSLHTKKSLTGWEEELEKTPLKPL